MVGFVSGCAPKVLLDQPAAFPATISGRALFHTPFAYIYASDPAEAGELDRLVREAASDFESDFGFLPSKPLLWVQDTANQPIYGTLRKWYDVSQALYAARYRRMSWNAQKLAEEFERESRASHAEMAFEYATIPIAFDNTELVYWHDAPWFPPASVNTILVMNTRSKVARSMRTFLAEMLKKELGIAWRVVLAPILALMEPQMVECIMVYPKTLLYAGWLKHDLIACHDDLKRYRHNYEMRKIREALGPIFSMLRTYAAPDQQQFIDDMEAGIGAPQEEDSSLTSPTAN